MVKNTVLTIYEYYINEKLNVYEVNNKTSDFSITMK